jgi:hypothetical protein
MYDYQSIDTLVSGVKGTTGFLSRLISRKSGFAFLFIVFAVIVSTIILN